MITGAHVLLYSPEADEVRRVLRDAIGWDAVDAGGGWLIFALPPAELGVHPSQTPSHQLTLMCDDIKATMGELQAKGITFSEDAQETRFGVAATMRLPGGVEVMLYEPRHPTAI